MSVSIKGFEWAQNGETMDALYKNTEETFGQAVALELDTAAALLPGDLISSGDVLIPHMQHIVIADEWEMAEQQNMYAKVTEAEAYDAIRGMRHIPAVLGSSVLAMAQER